MTDLRGRVASDAALRAALEVARSWGVRPTEFLGDPVVTVHQYDAAGRLVYSEHPGWSPDDVELAMGLAEFEADACPGCGAPLTETTDPANEEQYVAKVQAMCHRCVALDIAQNAAQNAPHPGALLIGARLKTQGDHDDPEVPA